MKSLRAVLVLSLLLLVAGCIPSVHPLYTGKDLLFEPALVGTWASKDGGEVWTVARGAGDVYNLDSREKDGNDVKTGKFEMRFFKVAGQGFVDFFPVEADSKRTYFYEAHTLPVHTFLRVREMGKVLKLEMLDPEWLKKLLKENPDALKHEVVRDGILLTAQPTDLQAFVTKYAEVKGAWTALEPLEKQ